MDVESRYCVGRDRGLGIKREFGTLASEFGVFFLHQDHLGSVTMVTDGAGNVVSGGSLGGKANYLYRPYGEIDRMNSSGPDITKYKYTGQEEDKESGLYYYKARYYDASLGRFNSADSLIMPESIQGMNRYMYVAGNPILYNDPTGHKLSSGQSWGLFAYFVGQQYGLSFEQMAGIAIGGRHKEKKKHKKSVEKNFLNNVGFAFDPGYRIYKAGQYLSGVGGKDKLDSRYKSAALGYMLNSQEGAIWGYLYGRSADKKKEMNRRHNQALAIEHTINLVIIAASAGLGAEGVESDTIGKSISNAFKNLGFKSVGARLALGGIIDYGLSNQIKGISEQMAGYDDDTERKIKGTYNMCFYAFTQHALNINDRNADFIGAMCATGIYPL
ncbi:MAG TPA: RHS repeat-associated core domain-containing protein [Leptospiraceae bacterium]|nr:RHS repeat-associated core domain-containing protein [Leptospiraceae bacterium]